MSAASLQPAAAGASGHSELVTPEDYPAAVAATMELCVTMLESRATKRELEGAVEKNVPIRGWGPHPSMIRRWARGLWLLKARRGEAAEAGGEGEGAAEAEGSEAARELPSGAVPVVVGLDEHSDTHLAIADPGPLLSSFSALSLSPFAPRRQSVAGTVPIDILRTIFSWLRPGYDYPRIQTYVAAARVCRCWTEAAVEYLWENVLMWDPDDIDEFAKVVAREQRCFLGPAAPALIRRLLIHLYDTGEEHLDHAAFGVIAMNCRSLRSVDITTTSNLMHLFSLGTFFHLWPNIVALEFKGRMDSIMEGFPLTVDALNTFWSGEVGTAFLQGIGRLKALDFSIDSNAPADIVTALCNAVHGATTD
ncbi:hypothetical protein BDK51DRAFT_26454, partial [Blyttiomyces helicus]